MELPPILDGGRRRGDGEPFDAFVHRPQVKMLAERFVLPEDPTR